MLLPIDKVPAKVGNPRYLVIYGKPKTGKTTIVAAIPNNLIIDLEGGSEFMDSLAVQARNLVDLSAIAKAIKDKISETGKFPYKYITIDSGTVLEDIAKQYALQLYQATPMAKDKVTGKIYNDDILKLPNGGGYYYLREAFDKIVSMFKVLCENFILVCHCKDNMINKEGREMSEMTVDLSGKLARIVAASSDAIGLVYRSGKKTYINFNGGSDSIVEARAPHLRGQEILISEADDENNVTVNWEKLYLPE